MNNLWRLADRLKEKCLTIYRKNVFLSQIGSKSRSVKILGKVYVNATDVKIGNNVVIYPGVYFWGDGKIIIGDNVNLGIGTIIYSKNCVSIGNDVAIAGQCYIIDSNHSFVKNIPINKQPMDIATGRGIVIGNDVWIGAGTKILKGAEIHDGAVIGAMSLVNSIIEKDAVAFGIPAKIKKYRL